MKEILDNAAKADSSKTLSPLEEIKSKLKISPDGAKLITNSDCIFLFPREGFFQIEFILS